jgi:sugar phosphate isomerase/epimerase
MVRFGVSSMFFHEYSCDEVFDFITEAGFDAVEFWPETPDFWLRDQPVGELVEILGQHSRIASLAVHTPILDLNPCSINPAVAAASVQYSLRAFRLAETVGASVFTVHPGRRTAKRVPSRADFDRFEYYVGMLREASEGSGVRVAMENMEPIVNSLLCTPDAMRELLDREPWIHFTLDLSHALAGSGGQVEDYLSACHDRLVNVHVSRASGGKVHLPVDGDGRTARILSSLADLGYDGFLTLEIEDRNFDHDLSSEEKITLLSRDLDFVMKSFG